MSVSDDGDRGVEPDRAGAGQAGRGQPDQRAVAQSGAERTTMELVERMRGDAHCERERREGVEQARDVEMRCHRGADRDVAEVPGGVGGWSSVTRSRQPPGASA